jgi:hypothetical protein
LAISFLVIRNINGPGYARRTVKACAGGAQASTGGDIEQQT